MKAEQIDHALRQKFLVEGNRLVFWHDPQGEFGDFVAEDLGEDLAGVRVIDLNREGCLATKLRIEREEPERQFLIYSSGEAPAAEEDWLLDVRHYSAEFHADMASLWLEELGLEQLSMRGYLKARGAFLGSQERRRKLLRMVSPGDDVAALDLKMMAVLVGSPVARPFEVLRALCQGHVREGHFSLDEPPQVMSTLEKVGLLPSFWSRMEGEFAYRVEEPSLAGLLRRLFITELLQQVGGGADLASLSHHQLPPGAGRQNAVVFLAQWRDSSGKAGSYDAAASAVAREQKVEEALRDLDLPTLGETFTFWDAEKRVASLLKDQILTEGSEVDPEAVSALVRQRKAGHWVSGPGSNDGDRRVVAEAYDAMVFAAELFSLRRETGASLSFSKAEELLAAYRRDLFRYDFLYRKFHTKAAAPASRGWDLLKSLAEEVERVYDQGFLQPLGVEWSRLLDQEFLARWSSVDFSAQQGFFKKHLRPHLQVAERRRAFVIISDAFRYEAAQELAETLNGKYRMDAELSAMLGVLPSYTALGMASLLPHENLAYNEKGEVLVDGHPVAGTQARSQHLSCVEGMACQAKELRGLKTEEARERTSGKRVVYIYHDVIDARGDSASTEEQTFAAVEECLRELVELVQFCVNKLNAAKVWVTADHGFLYQQESPNLTDRSQLGSVPSQAVITKKRYILGPNLGTALEAHHGSTAVTAGASGGMEFWIPRSNNRFHFTGGARFVHGGAMPQEVVVPVVTVTQLRGKQATGSRVEKVEVQVLGDSHKITTPRYRFELIQTEAVSERRKPITVRAAIYEGQQAVSSVETVTFDSSSSRIEERKKSIRIELRAGTFDKRKPYRLVLRDVESEAEVLSRPVVIDRSFDDDF